MAGCAACGSTIIFGGSTIANLRFCNEDCAARGQVVIASRSVPESQARLVAAKIHTGTCPKCSGPGPVDVRRAYRVWSALLFTRWTTLTEVSCRRCAIRQQALSTMSSATLGWWGVPWGLVMTPIQVVRNLVALARPHPPHTPSNDLVQHARLMLAAASFRAE